MLRQLVADRELRAINDTAFAVTPTLREAYASGDDEELAEVAMGEAARSALRLLADEREAAALRSEGDDAGDADAAPGDGYSSPVYRRAVIAADVTGASLRPDLDDAVVRLSAPITYDQIASVHVDLADAEPQVAKAVDVVDAADLGDPDAEFVLGDAEDHQLAWYAAQELPFLLDLL
ncbi:hypothetical protein IU500_16970 [Nocardia terpenica]|uniref:Uncharacterized protein n=1 Tax=Nocardia terpenica TaxID=455432 RepID=A0A164KMP5_9NOCA|nr:hypothetical protein [Nocardia terpenica]KZM71547.1 hypothetical protein AWN90_02045 [Nocardia terpenica]MBF6063178.1 hypothetical protein [Nocardia terpenica]MBF6105734.1 hypothetical protein [Nocardia terpenica]MBF6113682.1 hypothetical protein [Nocardia terpenica]MBF6119475.1 hypothetical protein [Nocardia terpenica]